jgi:hypothetical protein
MKKIITLSAIVATALIAAPLAINAQDAASTNSPSATTPAPAKKHGLSVRGKVTAVDTTAQTITVKDLTLNVTSTTKIVKDGSPATLDDIKVDDAVRIAYKKDSAGKLDATYIRDGVKKKTE